MKTRRCWGPRMNSVLIKITLRSTILKMFIVMATITSIFKIVDIKEFVYTWFTFCKIDFA